MYFPFVKLILSRYKPYSVRKDKEDVCLSPIVSANFTQLMPERQTTVRFKKDDINSKFTITVEGAIYNECLATHGNYSFLRISFQDIQVAQPIYGAVSDGTNEKDLTDEGVEIRITRRNIKNNWYSGSKEFKLPRSYKSAPFQIIIEEYERGQARIPQLDNFYKDRLEQSEETDHLIYADVFSVNSTEKR